MIARVRARYSLGGMDVAVATVSLTKGDRLAQDPAELLAEPIPWRSPDLTPTTLATLLAARFGERISADEAERVLRDLGAVVKRTDDTLYATAPAGARISLGAKPRWSIIGAIEPDGGRLMRLEVRYLSGK
jgi:hypothetical protein